MPETQLGFFGGEVIVNGRRAHDYYATPRWAIEAAMPMILKRLEISGSRWRTGRSRPPWVLEPGAGHGAIAVPLATAGCQVLGVEIRPEGVAETLAAAEVYDLADRLSCEEGDFLTVEEGPAGVTLNGRVIWKAPPLAAIGNPPFKDAVKFIDKVLALIAGGGFVAFLLPLSFLATIGRREFWESNPADILVLDERPDFTGKGGANAEYAFYFWPPIDGRRGQVFRLADLEDL